MHGIRDRGLARKSAQPLQQFRRIGVVAELFERGHLRPDGDYLSEYLHFRRAAFYRGAASSRRLETDEDDRILWIRKSLREVMLNASAGHHAAGGDNDQGKLILVDLLRLLRSGSERDARPTQG